MNVCNKCNKVYDDKSQFCDHCGDKLEENTSDVYRCDKCFKLFVNSEFCPNDGKPLKIYQRTLESNQIEIRYVEQYTVQIATKPMLLNMDEFKNCDPPFIGNDSNDFMFYLNNNVSGYRLESYLDKNESNLSENTKDALWYMNEYPGDDSENSIIYDSRNKSGNMWVELGKTNPDYTKNGGFETLESNQNN